MTHLVKYEAAKSALVEAKSFDEVKDIRDKAEAMRAYALMANDEELEADAAEIRVRAERRLGEMLKEARANKTILPGRNKTSCSTNGTGVAVYLPDIGIDRKLSMRAQKLAGISEQGFEASIARVRERIRNGAKVSLDVSSGDKAERRATRERDLAAKITALPTKKYGVILADPEWRFEPWSRQTGMDRAADNHYPTSATEVIAARDVASIAADDCVLFLWATVPMLPQALLVMGAWGFDYKSHCVWDKTIAGTGYWWRNRHELLLLGTKGSPPAPSPEDREHSVIACQKQKHSAKPETFLRLIEMWFPTLPKIELNRRGPPRIGWDAWGAEAESTESTNEPALDEAAHPPNGESDPVVSEDYGAGSPPPPFDPDDPKQSVSVA